MLSLKCSYISSKVENGYFVNYAYNDALIAPAANYSL